MNLHDYPFDLETVRLAVIVGVIVGMLFYERFHLTTGGAIVPGYLALFVPAPLFVVTTLLSGWITYVIVNRYIAKRYIVYGRLKFEIEILVGLALTAIWIFASPLFMQVHPMLAALQGIGFLIPAILAHDMARQSPRKTIVAVLINTAIVSLLVYVFHSFRMILPNGNSSAVQPLNDAAFAYPYDLLIFGVFLSVLAGMVIFRKLALRTGGFVTGGYLALVINDPREIVFVLAMGLITYVAVTRYLMRWMLIFGRRKLGVMTLTAAIVTWSAEILLTVATGRAWVPWSGFNVITLILPALLANDAQRQGPYRTLWGAGLTTVGVFAVMNLVHGVRLLLSGA